MPQPIGRYGEQTGTATSDLRTRTVAGAAAGNVTVTGIRPGDRLVAVQAVNVAAPNLVGEFTITAADTINNTGGTSTATQVLLVIWTRAQSGQSGFTI